MLIKKNPPLPAFKYHILELVGQGQFGRVYCAMNRKTKELVALKCLDYKSFSTHRFLRELRFLLTLKHPNIVSCNGLEYFKNNRYLVMDYCEGGTLRNLIESQKLNSLNSLIIIADLLKALIYCHNNEVIHCDIKPENILLNIRENGWKARLSDFGISRSINDSNYSYSPYIGSPAYMAPERFYGEYSVSSDLYSVGILLFELITGDRPFSGFYKDLINAHLTQPVNIPHSVPYLIRNIITKALEKLPQNRFNSAAEMLHSVEYALEVEKTTAVEKLACNPDFPTNFVSFLTKNLLPSIENLTIDNDHFYQVTNKQLIINQIVFSTVQLSSQYKLDLPIPLSAIHVTKSMLFFVFHSGNKASIYSLNKSQIEAGKIEKKLLVSLQCSSIFTAIDPDEKWLAIAKSYPNSSQVEIVKLPSYQPINSLLFSDQLTHLFVLNNRYGLAIFIDSKKTIFQLFNRRGHPLQSTFLSVILSQITPSLSDCYRLFAVENNSNQGLIINLQPWSVIRVDLPFYPDLVVATSWGFALADKKGQLICLNHNGQLFEYFDVSAMITAIAPWGENRLVLITPTAEQNYCYITVSAPKKRLFDCDQKEDLITE